MLRLLAPLVLVLAFGFLAQRFALWRSAKALDEQSTALIDPDLRPVLKALAKAQGITTIRLHLLANDTVNGLASADGRIFLTRGFYQKFQSGLVSADEIASVVAHELGHVALGHSRRRMIAFTGQNALRFALAAVLSRLIPFAGPWLAGLVTAAMMAGLSRRDEFQADEYAAALLAKAGIGTAPQKSLLAKLQSLTGMAHPGATDWLASHPATPDRIGAIEALERRWGLVTGP
jgi:metalloprotease